MKNEKTVKKVMGSFLGPGAKKDLRTKMTIFRVKGEKFEYLPEVNKLIVGTFSLDPDDASGAVVIFEEIESL